MLGDKLLIEYYVGLSDMSQITLRGKHFGPPSFASQVKIVIGNVPCISSTWVSPEEATCVTPARTGTAVSISILVSGALQILNANQV